MDVSLRTYLHGNPPNILDSLWKPRYDLVEIELNPLLIDWQDKKDIKDSRGGARDHDYAQTAFIIRV